jgi:hypothetical protein
MASEPYLKTLKTTGRDHSPNGADIYIGDDDQPADFQIRPQTSTEATYFARAGSAMGKSVSNP